MTQEPACGRGPIRHPSGVSGPPSTAPPQFPLTTHTPPSPGLPAHGDPNGARGGGSSFSTWARRALRYGPLALALVLIAFLGVPAQSVTLSGGITNVAPTISSITLAASVNPTAGSTTSIPVTIVASDANGCSDVTSVAVTVYQNDGTTVQVPQGAASLSTCVALLATYSYSFNMNFYDAPATYKVKVVATDAAGASANNTGALNTFVYNSLTALNLGSSSVSFGSIAPGGTGSAQTETVQNYGNVQIDIQVSGTNLTLASPAATIGVSSIKYSMNANMSSSSATSTSAVTLTTFDLVKGASSTKNLYTQLVVPSGSSQYVPGGTYTGTLTVTAVAG